MGDPLSVAASVAGLVSLGIQVCQQLINYYQSVSIQTSQTAKTVRSLRELSETLEGVSNSLERRKFKPEQMELMKIIENSIEECKDSTLDLQEELNTFNSESRPDSLKGKIRQNARRMAYPFKESTLLSLREHVQDIRENLALAIQSCIWTQLSTLWTTSPKSMLYYP